MNLTHLLHFDPLTVAQKEMARLGLSDWPYRTRATIAGIRKNLQVHCTALSVLSALQPDAAMVCSLFVYIPPMQRYVFEYGHKHCAPPTRTKIDALIAFVEEKEATVRANPKGERAFLKLLPWWLWPDAGGQGHTCVDE